MQIRGKAGKFKNAPASVKRAAIRAYLRKEGGLKTVAGRFGYRASTLMRWIREAGYKTRTISEGARRYAVDESYFEMIDTEEKAYWLGFIATDGCVIESGACRYLQVGLAEKDRGHLEELASAMSFAGPIHAYRSRPNPEAVHNKLSQEWYPYACLRVCSRKITDDLKALGIHPRKSLTVRPWAGPQELMRHYWRGVVDGDGSVHPPNRGKPNGALSLYGNKMMVFGFAQFMAAKLGRRLADIVPDENIFIFRIQGTALVQLAVAVLYENAAVCLDRKKFRADKILAMKCQRQARHDWSHLKAPQLRRLRRKLGSWAAVARELDIKEVSLWTVIKRLGVGPPAPAAPDTAPTESTPAATPGTSPPRSRTRPWPTRSR